MIAHRSGLARRSRTLAFRATPAAACLVALSAAAGAQGTATLSLEHVFTALLQHNPDIAKAQASVDVERGALVQARYPFDLRPRAALTNSRTVQSANSDVTQAVPSYVTLASRTKLELTKLFRSGIQVASELAVERTSPAELGGPTLNRLIADASVTVPLMQGRDGGLLAAVEHAAAKSHAAARQTLRSTAGAALFRATVAYWEYVAAFQRAAIHGAAARRSRQIVDEITILIRADERPRSDLDLMVANAASKQVAQLRAERQIIDARTALAGAIGLDLDQAATLADPGTAFPEQDETRHTPAVDEMIRDALARHDALAAAQTRRDSARALRDAAARQLKPRVDLLVGAGYTGQAGGGGIGRLFHPLFHNTLGPNASVQLLVEPSAINSLLRGTLISSDASYVQAVTAADALARGLRLQIANAAEGLANSRAQLDRTQEAVDRSRLALATVQRTFELGNATLFDRILAEDTLTNAELADLGARQEHAMALAELQSARGLVVEWRDGHLVADARRVLRASRGDGR
ncbi:MAG: TolC family protein [Vicinamibacterales bacterium]